MRVLAKGTIKIPHVASGSLCQFGYAILANPLGYRCGYLLIPNDHPWYRKHSREEAFHTVVVHGGLTFSGRLLNFGGDWWLGFDCGHYTDKPDPYLLSPLYRSLTFEHIGTIRTQEFVYNELVALAAQAAEAALAPSELDDWCQTLLELLQSS